MAQPLHLTMEGTNPLLLEWLWVSSFPFGGNLDIENTNILPEVLKLHSSQWLRQYISYLFLHRNTLELHCSLLHHIPDIVILDSQYALTCHGTSGSPTTSHNFGCHHIYKYHSTRDQIHQTVDSLAILPHN